MGKPASTSTSPSPAPLTASGASFADLQRGGLMHIVTLLLDANGVPEPVYGMARIAAGAPGACRTLAGLTDNHTAGCPTDHADTLRRLDECVTALRVVAQAAAEIRDLIAGAPGTLTTESGRPFGVPDRPVRRF